MRHTSGNLLIALGIAWACTCAAESTTMIGISDAQLCYEESRMLTSGGGVETCNRAIDQKGLNINDLAATYSNRGIIYSRNGKYQNALADHNKAIELVPTLAEAYINRGNVYYHTRDFERALEDYNRAIRLNAQPPVTGWYNKALTLIKLKRRNEARAALEQALKYAPDSDRIKESLEALKD